MSLIHMIACVALVSCSITSGRGGVQFDEKYLRLPTKDELLNQWNSYKPIKLALDAIGVQDEESISSSSDSYQSLLDRVREIYRPGDREAKLKVYEMLIDLANTQTCDTKKETAKYWLMAYALVKANYNGGQHGKLAGYLEHFGGQKFATCARQAELEFKQRESNEMRYKQALWREGDMDNFLIHMLKLKKHPTDAELYEKAKEFDLAKTVESSSSKKRLRMFCAKNKYPRRNAFVSEYFELECYYIGSAAGTLFDVINIAKAFGAYEISDTKLLKLNEYYRIFCTSPKEPELGKEIAKIIYQ